MMTGKAGDLCNPVRYNTVQLNAIILPLEPHCGLPRKEKGASQLGMRTSGQRRGTVHAFVVGICIELLDTPKSGSTIEG
jgi:hypothetical protein